MKKTDFPARISLKQILIERNDKPHWKFLRSISIGFNQKIYVLFSKEEYGEDLGFMELELNWETGTVISSAFYELGSFQLFGRAIELHYLGKELLLFNPRCIWSDETGYENNNAVIIDWQGNVRKSFNMGDGIENCHILHDGRIAVSYFDEGVFGSSIATNGVLVFDKSGKILWKNTHDVYDCYAMNVDEDDNLWYYYYDDFLLVKTNLEKEQIFHPSIEGASVFCISTDGKSIVFEGGYDEHDRYYYAAIGKDELGMFYPLGFALQNKPMEDLEQMQAIVRSSKFLFFDEKSRKGECWIYPTEIKSI